MKNKIINSLLLCCLLTPLSALSSKESPSSTHTDVKVISISFSSAKKENATTLQKAILKEQKLGWEYHSSMNIDDEYFISKLLIFKKASK